MKVTILGFPRTGTQSIAAALVELGYQSIYHMKEVGKYNHQGLWIAALEKKFTKASEEVGHEDLDRIFGEFDGASDFPAAIFAKELIEAYPGAKLILSVRDEDLWYKSMMATLIHAFDNVPPEPTSMRPLAEKYHEYIWKSDFPTYGRDAYRKHNEEVSRICKESGRVLLTYDVKHGWGPLCEFLGKEVPNSAFPRADDWLEYKKTFSAA